MIIEQDNFIDKNECESLINFYRSYFPAYGRHFAGTQLIDLWHLKNKFEFINALSKKFMDHIRPINDKVVIDYFEIVQRFPNTSMNGHFDFAHQKYTSVIYLNDDYEGGETIIENKKFTPKTGKIITFEGPKMFHGISMIEKTSRFAMPIWYK